MIDFFISRWWNKIWSSAGFGDAEDSTAVNSIQVESQSDEELFLDAVLTGDIFYHALLEKACLELIWIYKSHSIKETKSCKSVISKGSTDAFSISP